MNRKIVLIGSFNESENEKDSTEAIITASKLSKLNMMYIKYLVEKKIPKLVEGVSRYDAEVYYATSGEISKNVLDAVRDADVVIALLTEVNANVLFELTTRAAFQKAFILLVAQDVSMPMYLRDVAKITYNPAMDLDITKHITLLSEQQSLDLTWQSVKNGDIPKDLELKINAKEEGPKLFQELADALINIENSPPKSPDFIRVVFRDLDPERFMEGWGPDIPTSVIRVKWKKKFKEDDTEIEYYREEDMDGLPVVCWANEGYQAVFGLRVQEGSEPTALSLQTCLAKHMDKDKLEIFNRDQDRTFRESIMENKFSWAKVPIELNDNHPTLKGKVYLPVIVGRKFLTYKESYYRPHVMYMIVILVEDFYPQAELKRRGMLTDAEKPTE